MLSPPSPWLPAPVWQFACGVGHNPDAISSVRGIDGASWNNNRPRGVAFAFQVKQHFVEAHCDVTSNVFSHDPAGSFVLNNLKHRRPEVAVIRCAFLLPGNGEGLAWIAPCDDVDVAFKVDGSDVVVDRDVGPVLSQDSLAEGVLLTECDCPKSSRCFESEAEPSDAAEEVNNFKHFD